MLGMKEKSIIGRILHRNDSFAIAQELDSSQSLLQAVRATRQDTDYEQKTTSALSIFRRIQNEMFVIDPRMQLLSTELSKRLQKAFPFVRGIVLFGSAVTGGSLVRSALQGKNYEPPDLDWTLITTRELTQKEKSQVATESHFFLKAYSQDYGFEGAVHSCYMYSGDHFQIQEPEPHADIFRTFFNTTMDPASTECVLRLPTHWFFPTFPADIGERNQKRVMDGLTRVYEESGFDSWKIIVDALVHQWSQLDGVREKHMTNYSIEIGPKQTRWMQKTWSLAHELKKEAITSNQQLFRELLESTGPSKNAMPR